MSTSYKLAVLNSHPIQYFAPLYRRIAQEPDIDLTVFFCHKMGAEEYHDPGFGVRVKWDIPLLEGYRYEFLPNLRSNGLSGYFSLINPSIINRLRQERFDALWVHGHGYFTHQLAILSAKALGIPVLMRSETHLLLSRPKLKRILRRPLLSLFYRLFCSACLPIGTRNRDFYRHHRVTDKQMFLVPYTVDNDFFITAIAEESKTADEWRQRYGLTTSLPVILYASKLSSRKHPMLLLKAYRKLREQDALAQLVYVGTGPEEANLKDYVRRYDVPDVFFFGFRNQTELPRFYALADVFVLPSVNEPWGLVINEAMCGGLPIVASDVVGASADLVRHGENGFVFAAGDADALSDALVRLVQNDDMRRRMGKRSLEIIREWSYDRDVEGIREAMYYLRKRQAGT